MAKNRSTMINTKWKSDKGQKKFAGDLETLCNRHTTLVMSPCSVVIITEMWGGWTRIPTAITSVIAKKASPMLDRLCSRAFIFTAITTRTFNTMVNGQAIARMNILKTITLYVYAEKCSGTPPMKWYKSHFKGLVFRLEFMADGFFGFIANLPFFARGKLSLCAVQSVISFQ